MSFVTLFFGQSGLHSCTTFLSFIFLVFEEKFGGLKILQPPEPLRLLELVFVESHPRKKGDLGNDFCEEKTIDSTGLI